MGLMTSSTGSSRRPAGRLFVLLVMAVLTGVLGMHALGPAGAPSPRMDAGHDMVMTMADGAAHASEGCSHADGGPDHLDQLRAAVGAPVEGATAGAGSTGQPDPRIGSTGGPRRTA